MNTEHLLGHDNIHSRVCLRPAALAGLFLIVLAITSPCVNAGEATAPALEGLKFSTLAYVDYSRGQAALPDGGNSNYNRFKLNRGYFTVKKTMLPWLGMRATIDIHQDNTGDYKARQKYFYAELRPDDLGPLTGMKAEIGMGHMPWLDYEEHMNPYRCQGTMAIERAGVFNSADIGLSLRGDIGGKLEDAEGKTGNHSYTGRYGSWHVGIYNGGGYHAAEDNENKVVEGRLSIRPLADIAPGLQFNYLGIYGKGNTLSERLRDYPDYIVNLGMVSFEHPMVVLTAQYFITAGNAKGTWADTTTGEALSTEGLSLFGNVKIPELKEKLSLFFRLEHFDIDRDNVFADKTAYTMILGGLAYELYKGNMVLLVYEVTDYEDDAAPKKKLPVLDNKLGDEQEFQVVYQIKF